jgi:TetR/AcrR family transcriptional regulator
MATNPQLRPETATGADSTGRILDAAAELFAEYGFDGASMSAIAERAGVSKANVFHHFSSKKELYLAVVRAACRKSERLDDLDERNGPFEQRLRDYSAGMLDDMLRQKRIHQLITRELMMHGEQLGKELAEKVFGDNFARFVAILRAGQARGELRADVDPAMVATALIGTNVFFFQSQEVLRHLRDVSFADDPARYVRMQVELLLHGIATTGTDEQPDKN